MAIDIFEEFKNNCTGYTLDFNNVVLQNGENRFILFAPTEQVDYLFYEATYGKARVSGTVSNIEDLVEIAVETVGGQNIAIKKVKRCNYYY